MIGALAPPPAERRILAGSPLRSITPWIVAVMSFTILLVAAFGLVTARAAGEISGSIGQRYVVTVPAGGGDAAGIARRIGSMPGVVAVETVSEAAMRERLTNWLGASAESDDLPIPALVKFELAKGSDIARIEPIIRTNVPGATVSAFRDQVAPLLSSMRLLQWVALALVLLLGAAASSAVVLAARGAIDSRRATVDVLHGIGATDQQVTRLFQHRIALDTFAGSVAGSAVAGGVLLLIAAGARWAAELSGLALRPTDILLLLALPLLLTVIATVAARAAILAALREAL